MAVIEENLNLTDLIDVEILQKIQDAFSLMTGIVSLTTDRSGIAVTQGSNFTDFCTKYVRPTEVGRKQCENCDRMGAELAYREGSSCAYFCHAGLVDFAAPIMAGGHMVGCFIGGQVLTEPPDDEKMRKVAEEIGVDPEEFIAAAHKISIVDKGTVDNETKALYTIANVLSEIAFNKYQLYINNLELEKASRMKSDFLANMSHEIRTPMNAIIGLAEMTLREDLAPTAREYVGQIKSSGQTLLTIINDILDFSKIESGKMDISEIKYEPMSLIHDVANIIMTRIGNKNLELTIDVDPDLPSELYGDDIRIKQVMVNLSNNAVKFTEEGRVHLKVDFDRTEEDMIDLCIAVSDTGRGIKKEDMDKLFRSFQQVDSKRNRNIEGTGLGLAISRQLVTLMQGKIHVESEYGKGSTFSFSVPQKVIKGDPSIRKMEEKALVAGLFINEYIAQEMETDIARLGMEYVRIASESDLIVLKGEGVRYLFTEYDLFTETVQNYLRNNPDITGIVLVGFRSLYTSPLPNVHIIKKPLYALSLAGIFQGEDAYAGYMQAEVSDFDFIAPDAEILLVDDNAINLTIVQGLLEPLNMKIETALSGMAAINKIKDKRYDLVFMDHMMPEMDGVEATRVIRRMLGENGQIPIIALTANAVEGTREMLISEGMNDFVAKPIELKVILSKLRKWLPREKQQKLSRRKWEEGLHGQAEDHASGTTNIYIEGLDIQEAMRLMGNEKLFWAVLKEYYRVIDKKYGLIQKYEEEEQWREYTIEVHSLKSSSRQIGAMKLAAIAEQMEKAGNAGDVELIHEVTPKMLEKYLHYKDILAPYFLEKGEEQSGEQIGEEALKGFFERMRSALDNLDMDAMGEIIRDMSKYSYDGQQRGFFEGLKSVADDMDTEKCENILKEWKDTIFPDTEF